MKNTLKTPRHPSRREFIRRAREILQEIQKDLLPRHGAEIVAINVENRQYTIGADLDESIRAFRERWPDVLPYLVRADGGPVIKFHGIGSTNPKIPRPTPAVSREPS